MPPEWVETLEWMKLVQEMLQNLRVDVTLALIISIVAFFLGITALLVAVMALKK